MNKYKHAPTSNKVKAVHLEQQSFGGTALVSSGDISKAVMYKHAKQFLPASSTHFLELSVSTFLSPTIAQIPEQTQFVCVFVFNAYPLSTDLSDVHPCKQSNFATPLLPPNSSH